MFHGVSYQELIVTFSGKSLNSYHCTLETYNNFNFIWRIYSFIFNGNVRNYFVIRRKQKQIRRRNFITKRHLKEISYGNTNLM